MTPELELVRRAEAGDDDAFRQLLAPLEPGLRALIRSALYGRPDLDVDEVLQDTRIYLHARLDRFNPEYAFGVFARGLARTIVRRHRGARSDLAPGAPDGEGDDFPGELSPAELAALPIQAVRVLGGDRFAPPDGPTGPSREFLDLFEALLTHGGYPHQQLSFGYSVLLWGRRDPRAAAPRSAAAPENARVPITGDPDRVVTEVGPQPLAPAAAGFFSEIGDALPLDPAYLNRVRRPLEERLALSGGTLFAADPAARKAYPGVLACIVGGTCLRDYFGRNPRQSVSDWTRNVKERIRRHYTGAGGRGASASQKSAGSGV